MFDWSDLRTFLAVARSGSTAAAGRELRVSQTTAARRISALESALGLTLFERRQSGYVLTSDGEGLLDHAVAVEASAVGFRDAADARTRVASGTVRLTTAEIYAVTILAPMVRDLHAAFPLIDLELETSDEMRDLAGGAADVALRASGDPHGAGLVGRRIAEDPWSIYCSRGYADAHGVPRSRAQLHDHVLIGGGGGGVWPYYQRWLKENGLEAAVSIRHSSPAGLLSAVRSGAGCAVLPRTVAESDSELIRCLPPSPGYTASLWLLTHERVRHAPHVRAVTDFLYGELMRLVRRLDVTPAV